MNIGIVGLGFMGMIHFLTYRKVRQARVKAICEQIPHRLEGDWRDIKGNFGPAGTRVDLSGVDPYSELEAMLADPDIDLVDICLPPALHADAAVAALRAGKDVFCEKPMALSDRDTHRMASVAQQMKRLLMVGHVLPMFPEFRFAHEAAAKGTLGRLLGGHFERVISDPAWLKRYYDPSWIGGPMLDLHVHDAHFIRLLFGPPRAVQGVGRMRNGVASYFESQFFFDRTELVVTARGGVIPQPGRGFLHGFELHFEKATLAFQSGVFGDEPRTPMPLTIFPNRGGTRVPEMGSGDPMTAFEAELTQVVKAVRTRTIPDFLSYPLAQDAVRICHAETKAVQTGKRIRIA